MKHLSHSKKKFSRKTGQRRAFMRGLANNVIRRGRVETTIARAKAIRPVVERAVTIAKKETLASRRVLESRFHDQVVVEKLIRDLGPRYKSRAGGYTRIIKTGKMRRRDGVETAIIEFV
jgi:large subunit ribosomal protein L17